MEEVAQVCSRGIVHRDTREAMSSHESNSSGPARPPTPGLHLSRTSVPIYQNDEYYETKQDSSSRLASLDLTSTRETYDTYDTWTELRELP